MRKPLRALLALLPALAMVPVAEIALRWAVPDVEIRTPLARGGFLRPYVPNAEADLVSADFRVRYAIDEHGFRDLRGRVVEPRAPGRPMRVLLLGDSFTEGYGVEPQQTFGRLLAHELNPNPSYETWNLGRMGASPLFYIVMAREFVPRLRPRLVVVQLFDNDLDENRFRRIPREPDGRVGAFPGSLRPRSDELGRLGDTWRGLALVQAFDRLGRRLRGKLVPRIFVREGSHIAQPPWPGAGEARLFAWYDPERAPEWAAKFAEQEVLVRQLVAELRAMDVQPLITYVPHGAELVAGDPAASRARNPHARMLARVTGELGVPYLDGTDVFAAPGRVPSHYYFEHDQHWNVDGHALFAEALEARITWGRDLLGGPIP